MEITDQYINGNGELVQIMTDGKRFKVWNTEWAVMVGYAPTLRLARAIAETNVEDLSDC